MSLTRRKMSFRIKILIISLIILTLIGVLGFLAYYKFSGIVTQVSEATKTDRSIALAKEIMTDLTSAENRVKSYTLSRDKSFIDQFDSISLNIEEKIILLYSGEKSSVATKQDMDTLIQLVNEKFEILTQLLVMQNEFRVQDAFGEIEERIQQSTTTLTQAAQDEKKDKRLFRKRDKSPKVDQNEKAVNELKQKINVVSKAETRKEQVLIGKELELIQEDALVTEQISSLLKQFENDEIIRIENRTELVKKDVQTTKALIAIVCIVTGLFILIMIYTIINYLRSNNRYLKMIKKAKKESDQLTRAKERFIATISHELRTPMNSIVGFTEQIAQGPLTKLQQSQMDIVRKASDHLLHLINEFLDFSKLQENKLTLVSEPFSPASVIQEVTEISSSIAASKGIPIHTELLNDADIIVLGDAFRLRQILLNILGNAIKFTSKGEIKVLAQMTTSNQDQRCLNIEIEDTGVGIDPQKLNSVFDVFEQESSSVASEYGGSGLGLSITKRLVELQGGTISIESQKNVGTKVLIRIPFKIGEALRLNEAPHLKFEAADLKGLNVLVVDDEKYNRDLLKAILRKYMVNVCELDDGIGVADHIQKNKTDLILMDVRMPLMSGIDATKNIRNLEHFNSKIPIALLTAAVTDEEKFGYLSAGADLILPKPFTESQLVELILKMIGKEDSPMHFVETNTKWDIDFTALKQTSGEDLHFYKSMLTTLVDSIKKAQSDLMASLEKNDIDSTAEYAHRICAPVKHINAQALYKHLKTLEKNCRSQLNLESNQFIMNEINKEAVLVCKTIENEVAKIDV